MERGAASVGAGVGFDEGASGASPRGIGAGVLKCWVLVLLAGLGNLKCRSSAGVRGQVLGAACWVLVLLLVLVLVPTIIPNSR